MESFEINNIINSSIAKIEVNNFANSK